MLTLRDYQEDALARIAGAEERGVARQLLVAATGLGKTVMFTAMAERRGGRTLILAHRDELIAQAVAKVVEVDPTLSLTPSVAQALAGIGRSDLVLRPNPTVSSGSVGIIKAGANDVRARVVVASVQTLARSRRLEQLTDAIRSSLIPVPDFGLVVTDEAHHATADSYRRIYEALRVGQPACPAAAAAQEWSPDLDPIGPRSECTCPEGAHPSEAGPLHVGFTATPDRGDGQGLSDVFAEVVASYDMLWGIRAGYLSDLRGRLLEVDAFEEAELRRTRGDYDQGQAGRILEAAGAHELIVRGWQLHAADRAKTLVFTPTVAFAQAVADSFVAAGIPAAMVSGETPADERRALLERFRTGELRVLANCAVLTEGYDEPGIDCVVIARPTQSRALYTQMVGRGTRRHPAKTDCLVLDVVGASSEHSLVTIPSLFGVEKEAREHPERTMTEAVEHREREERAAGIVRARDVDLFSAVRSAGIAWVAVHELGEPTTYIRPIQHGPTVRLHELAPGLWTAELLQGPGSAPTPLPGAQAVSLELAQGIAEDFVRAHSPAALASADAPWRLRPPSAKARRFASSLGVKVPADWNAGQVSDAIDRAKARRAR